MNHCHSAQQQQQQPPPDTATTSAVAGRYRYSNNSPSPHEGPPWSGIMPSSIHTLGNHNAYYPQQQQQSASLQPAQAQIPTHPASQFVPPQSHQQPVNFHPRDMPSASAARHPADAAGYPSRRVTIGGTQHPSTLPAPPLHNDATGVMDRRGSMASMNFNMDDFFNRRPSMGMDSGGNMDLLFGAAARRGSMDSTSAALDAAILDLQRRRFSVAAMETDNNNAMSSFQQQQPHAAGPPNGNANNHNHNVNNANHMSSISARQHQLQQQQRELEQRQKELELQRQQLIASMQERNMPMSHRGSYGFGAGGGPPPGHHYGHGTGSLGLGSVGSHGSHGSHPQHPHNMAPHTHRGSTAPHLGLSLNSTGSGPATTPPASNSSQQWWICQVCNSKAFASHEEAMTHERVCSGANGPHNNGMMAPHPTASGMPLPHHGYGAHNNPLSNQAFFDHSQRSAMNDSLHGGRNFSLGMDSSAGASYNNPAMSNGPFALMEKPMPLAMESDKDWLTPLHCFVRRQCVEVFTATQDDVSTPSKGKRKPIHVGQVGIRCPHCHVQDSSKARERGSVYYPTSISSIYNATMNLLQRHLHNCSCVPDDIMRRYETLKADDARSGTSKRYWVESSLSLGLVDTANGIRFSALQPPPLPSLTSSQERSGFHAARRNSNEFFSTHSNAMTELSEKSNRANKDGDDEHGDDAIDPHSGPGDRDPNFSKAEQDMADSAPLVTVEDKPYSTSFSYHLLSQMQPCLFTEADRLGKRKGLPPGFPGLACRHCFGGYGSGRFFPSSIKTLSDTSKTLNVLHNHMMRCRKCPPEVRENLERLRGAHDDERAKMKFGSQKAFFARIWERLHGKHSSGTTAAFKRKARSNNVIDRDGAMPGNHMGGMGPPPGMGGGMSGGMDHGYGTSPHMGMMRAPHASAAYRQMPIPMGGNSGLEALAQASDPKRAKLH